MLLKVVKYGNAAFMYAANAVTLPLVNVLGTSSFIMGVNHAQPLNMYTIGGLVAMLAGLALWSNALWSNDKPKSGASVTRSCVCVCCVLCTPSLTSCCLLSPCVQASWALLGSPWASATWQAPRGIAGQAQTSHTLPATRWHCGVGCTHAWVCPRLGPAGPSPQSRKCALLFPHLQYTALSLTLFSSPIAHAMPPAGPHCLDSHRCPHGLLLALHLPMLTRARGIVSMPSTCWLKRNRAINTM